MAYLIRVSVHQGYLKFHARGERTLEDAEDFIRRIAEETSRRGIYNALVVLELTGRLPVENVFDLLVNYQRYGLTGRHKLAAYDMNVESRPDNDFAENVGQNRGLNVVSFASEDEAVKWLLTEEKTPAPA